MIQRKGYLPSCCFDSDHSVPGRSQTRLTAGDVMCVFGNEYILVRSQTINTPAKRDTTTRIVMVFLYKCSSFE